MASNNSRFYRIVTDIELSNHLGDAVEVDHIGDRRLSMAGWFRRVSGADALVLRLPSKYTALLCLTARIRSRRLRVVYYDVNIPIATDRWDWLKRKVFLSLVRRADLILTLQADTAGYARLLNVPQERLRYVGFKSNGWEDQKAVTRGKETRDSGTYVLACGRSYRDFATFADAMAEAGLPARILLSAGDVRQEGSILPRELPENVQIIQHDGSRSSWVNALLGARIVVVPLRVGVHQPAGVSVYLEAMNLSRPVIVSEGPSTRMMLDESTAGVVPPGNASALAREAVRIWSDEHLRLGRIANGWEYVQGLGGLDRMSRDILEATLSLLKRPGSGESLGDERDFQQKTTGVSSLTRR